MSAATLAAVAAVFVGATVQSAIGFGFAIIAAPVLAATAGPETAAPTLAVIGLASSALLLVAEGRPSEVLRGTTVRLLAWALPGMAVGAIVLAGASSDALSVLVAAGVLVAVAAHALRARRLGGARRAPARWPSTAAAGAFSGAMQTSTGLNGPPLVLHLLGRATPAQARDTLAAVFVASNALSLVAFAVSGTFDAAPDLLALSLAAVAGWALGRRGFAFLQDHHEAVSLALLVVGALVAAGLAIDALS